MHLTVKWPGVLPSGCNFGAKPSGIQGLEGFTATGFNKDGDIMRCCTITQSQVCGNGVSHIPNLWQVRRWWSGCKRVAHFIQPETSGGDVSLLRIQETGAASWRWSTLRSCFQYPDAWILCFRPLKLIQLQDGWVVEYSKCLAMWGPLLLFLSHTCHTQIVHENGYRSLSVPCSP